MTVRILDITSCLTKQNIDLVEMLFGKDDVEYVFDMLGIIVQEAILDTPRLDNPKYLNVTFRFSLLHILNMHCKGVIKLPKFRRLFSLLTLKLSCLKREFNESMSMDEECYKKAKNIAEEFSRESGFMTSDPMHF